MFTDIDFSSGFGLLLLLLLIVWAIMAFLLVFKLWSACTDIAYMREMQQEQLRLLRRLIDQDAPPSMEEEQKETEKLRPTNALDNYIK